MSFGSSRLRSTQSRLPALLSREAYSRLQGASDLREFYRRITARLAIGAFPEPEQAAQYEQEWGRPQSLQAEIKEVERLIQDWRKRGGDTSLLTPVLGALRQELAESQGKIAEAHTEAQTEDMLRLASHEDLPEGFSSVGGGFYREGHSIWELRGAEDEEGGYVLARRREERAVDMRPQPAVGQVVTESRRACISCLPPGTPALFIRNGQAMPVIIIDVGGGDHKGHEDEAIVEDETGAQMPAPLDMIITDMTVKMPGMLPQMPAPQPAMPQVAPLQVAAPPQMAPSSQMAPPQWMVNEMQQDLQQMQPMAQPQMQSGMANPTEVAGDMSTCDCDRGCSCPCHNGKSVKKGPQQGMDPKVEPSSKDPDAGGSPGDFGGAEGANDGGQEDQGQDNTPPMADSESEPTEEETDAAVKKAFFMRAYGPEEAWGDFVIVTKRFAPQYMGGRSVLDPGQNITYRVAESSSASPQKDRMLGVPNPVLPYPNAKAGERALNDRIALVPHGGGEPVFVSPMELERNFGPANNVRQAKPNPSLRDNISHGLLPGARVFDPQSPNEHYTMEGYEPVRGKNNDVEDFNVRLMPHGQPSGQPVTKSYKNQVMNWGLVPGHLPEEGEDVDMDDYAPPAPAVRPAVTRQFSNEPTNVMRAPPQQRSIQDTTVTQKSPLSRTPRPR